METAMARPIHGVWVASVLGYIITAAAIVVLALLLVETDDRTPQFWRNMLWTEVLALVVWGGLGAYAFYAIRRSMPSGATGGVLPAVNVVVIIYAIISFALMLVHAAGESSELYDRLHLATQVLLAAAALGIFVFLYLARAGAAAGGEPVPEGVPAPPALAAAIRTQEDRLASSEATADLAARLKALREKLTYSLPHAGTVGRSAEYGMLAAEVQQLSEEAGRIDPASPGEERAAGAARRADEISRKVTALAQGLRK